MPVVQINLYEGRSDEEKTGICRSIQNSIKETLSIPHDNFLHRIFEFNDSNMLIPPGKSQNYIFIELDVFPGRDESLKLKLFKKIEENLQQFNIQQNDILIIYREPSLEDWYISGKTGTQRSKNR
ncbi:MAG TPA: tautomerase family protein [Desulfomonilaceae bacterium]|nr:tautomerase family protein [Desulfomonilaceae bacterium]